MDKSGANNNPLGKQSNYYNNYDKKLLFPILREEYRKQIKTPSIIGNDIWTAYEFSWLNLQGVPQLAILQIIVAADSKLITESKSLKLYLGGFAGEKFHSEAEVSVRILADLKEATQSDSVTVNLIRPTDWRLLCQIVEPVGECLDDKISSCSIFDYSPSLLKTSKMSPKKEILVYSNLFRSLCPVTSQPDWATVSIEAEGGYWDYEALGQYLVSFRNHNGFHEHCCETIMSDILESCRPEFLSVECKFTRRGGIDINPFRTTNGARRDSILKGHSPKIINLSRLARQ